MVNFRHRTPQKEPSIVHPALGLSFQRPFILDRSTSQLSPPPAPPLLQLPADASPPTNGAGGGEGFSGGVGGEIFLGGEIVLRASALTISTDHSRFALTDELTPGKMVYTLHPTPCTLLPTPYTLHSTPYYLHLTPCTLHPMPCTLDPEACALNLPLPAVGKQVGPNVNFWQEFLMCVQKLPICGTNVRRTVRFGGRAHAWKDGLAPSCPRKHHSEAFC